MWITDEIQYRDIESDGPSTSAEAAQRQLQAHLPPALPSPQQAPANTKTLREMLSMEDRIVQISFEDVFTNSKTSHSREEDMVLGCGFNKNRTRTESHQKVLVLVFAARSLLTPFNIVLNAYLRTNDTSGLANLLEENVKAAEDMGLTVKAIVCGRGPENRLILDY
uniref:Transposable element P transposase-like RNase H domain-containing protein n=1 Tax=Glossina morsitans morsitans TaxID=37546 RepID=A0A1B0FDK7_GLOMM